MHTDDFEAVYVDGTPYEARHIRAMRDNCARLGEETAKLREAVKWCLEKEPSPCRCMDFSTPPHVCVAHRALKS